MENTLSPAETKFFETGELPAEIAHPIHDMPPPAAPAPEPIYVPPAPPSPVPLAPEPEPEPAPKPVDSTEFLQRALADEARRRAELEAKYTEVQAKIDELTKPRIPEPDQLVDPLGHLNWQLKQMHEQIAKLSTRSTEAAQQTEQQVRYNAFAENVRALKTEFLKVSPDFDAAHAHMRNLRSADLAAFGMPPDQIPQRLQQEEIALAENAIRFGKNPAAELYAMAKRYGYAPPKPAAKPPTLTQQLEQLKRGVAAEPVVPGRTAPPSADPTVDTLRTAGDADLNSLVADDAAWHRIIGNGQRGIF